MAIGKGGLGLILLAAVVVPTSYFAINYAGTPIHDATGTIIELREGVVQRGSVACYAIIQGEGVGVVADKFSGECPKNLRVGQRVGFRYRQGRFVTNTLVFASSERGEDLKILGQASQ